METFSQCGKQPKMELVREFTGLMTTTFGSSLACFLAHSGGAGSVVLRSSTLPESQLLLLLGGGLIVLAGLVKRLYPAGGVAAPKSMQMMVWISPEEVVDHFSTVNGD